MRSSYTAYKNAKIKKFSCLEKRKANEAFGMNMKGWNLDLKIVLESSKYCEKLGLGINCVIIRNRYEIISWSGWG